MSEQAYRNGNATASGRTPEARYSYYRRCQLFRRNDQQCKAPAEKGAQICHAHAAQQAMAFRRELEQRIVLAEAVAQMRRQGKPNCEMADLFTDFKGIQVTLAVVSRALIAGRIDCKTAGRLLVHLQTVAKLLRIYHRDHRGTQREKTLTTKDTKKHEGLPQICADERRLNREQELPVLTTPQAATPSMIERVIHAEKPRASFNARVRAIPEKPRSLQNGKWEQPRAA